MTKANNPKFVCPIHVGESTYVPALKQNVLAKFTDFNANGYPDSIGAVIPPEKAKEGSVRPPEPPGNIEGKKPKEKMPKEKK